MIELRALSKAYPNSPRPSVDGIDLSVGMGEFVALIGQSGSGKTTTLNMINRLIEPSSGTICVDGEDVRKADPVNLRRHIGYVFQAVGLFPHLTVAENVGITARLLSWPAKEIAQRVDELLLLMRLPPREFRDRLPHALSGGQRQRVGLARALCVRPRIMLMDEPFGALDPVIRDELSSDYRRIHDSLGLTTVLVTHDMTEALLLADRIAVMRDGRIVQADTPQNICAHPADDFVRALVETPKRRAQLLHAAMQTGNA